MPNKTIQMEYDWKYKDLIPYSWMVNDLYKGVQAEQNYLVALGLFAYSEMVGRKILGTIGNQGGGLVAFREFTEKQVGYSFTDQEWKDIFDKYRNGLAHEFFIKDNGGGVYNEDGTAACGIDISNKFIVKINSYFKHFVTGLEKALDQNLLKKL